MTKKIEKIQTTLRVPADLYEQVKEIAAREGISINDAILAFIEVGVDCSGVTSTFNDFVKATNILIESLTEEQNDYLFQLAKDDMRPISYQIAVLVKEAMDARMPPKKKS